LKQLENWAVASTAEYKRLRGLAKQIEKFNHPPFTVTRNGDKVTKEKATDVLDYVVEDAKKDFTITRFKGLGEMNAEQLWDTTMNADTRTLLTRWDLSLHCCVSILPSRLATLWRRLHSVG
jgi:DNA gyrase/topoisomerase IV subunit B